MDTERKLDILLEFGKEVAKENNLDELLAHMADFAKKLLDADRCSIFIYDDKKNELWTRVAHGVKSEIRIDATKGIAGYAAISQENQIITDAYKDSRFNPDIDNKTGYTTKTILAVPLVDHQNKTLGVFQVLNKHNGTFTHNDIQLLQLISNHASASIENALLTYKVKQNQLNVINKLSTAAELKEKDTSNHTKRVGEYSALLAQKMNFSDEEVELLRFTAPMHDVGKIGISDTILLKKTKLSDAEFEVMKSHPKLGYNLLKDEESDFLQMASTIALDHHEKYDGSGYPNGKKGDEISLYGRIVSLVDVFDALTTKRPYKQAWDFEKSLEYIKSLSGKQFDPVLVDIFEKSYEDIKSIYHKLKD